MSMQDYAVHEYGLLLTTEDMKEISKRLFEDFTKKDWEEDEWGFIEAATSKLGIVYISDFTGEAVPISENGFTEWVGETSFDSDWVFYLAARKLPTLFRAAYKDMDELVEEFRSTLQNYLPRDFDYRSKVRELIGTYFGYKEK